MNKTASQIKKDISKAGIDGELTGRGKEWEIKVADKGTAVRFCNEIASVRGYMNNYGEWILRPGFNFGDTVLYA